MCAYARRQVASLQQKLGTTTPKKWHRQICLRPKGAPAQQVAEQVFWNSLAGTHKLTLSTTEESQPDLRPREKLPWAEEGKDVRIPEPERLPCLHCPFHSL